MEVRKAGTPVLPVWLKIKSAHKELGDGSFKPDVAGLIKKYDSLFPAYDKLLEEKKKLPGAIGEFAKIVAGYKAAVADSADARDKIDKDTSAEMNRHSDTLNDLSSQTDPDLSAMDGALDGFSKATEEHNTLHQALTKTIEAQNTKVQGQFKTLRANFKTKLDTVTKGIASAETEAEKMGGQIRAVLLTYQKTAAGMKDTKAGTAIIADLRDVQALVD